MKTGVKKKITRSWLSCEMVAYNVVKVMAWVKGEVNSYHYDK